MPFDGPDSLPEELRNRLNDKQRRAFVQVFNQAYRRSKGTDEEREQIAFRAANAIVRRMSKADAPAFHRVVQIEKIDEEQRMVFGWAYVTKDDSGNDVVDHSGEIVSLEEIEKAAVEFVKESRRGGEMHQARKTAGHIVHSLVITDEVAGALGIVGKRRGWFIGYQVTDDRVWEMVKNRQYSAFSIGGSATVEDIYDAAA